MHVAMQNYGKDKNS